MAQGSMTANPERAPSEAADRGDLLLAINDVVQAYVVFLGRLPEKGAQVDFWLGRTLSDLLNAFFVSSEFIDLQMSIVTDGELQLRYPVPQLALTEADHWLSSIAPDRRQWGSTEWSDLLFAAVTSPDILAIADPKFDPEALAVLNEAIDARRDASETIRLLTNFDTEAFHSSLAGRVYRNAAGGIALDSIIPATVEPPVLLPMFTEGLAHIRHGGDTTLGEWLDRTQAGAIEGVLTHWLWDEPTYLRNRSVADRGLPSDVSNNSAFLEFLAIGDRAGVSPHPLFCHHGYRVMNGLELEPAQGAFRHFVLHGQDATFRTSALFDADYYLARQPEVRLLLSNGSFASALEHFVRVGMAQGYAFLPDFDRDFYIANNPDVAQIVADGITPTAEWHYVFHGASEGRAPNPFFNPHYYAERYPFIHEEMRRRGIKSTIEHFLLLGRARGWRVNRPLNERHVASVDGKALFEKRCHRAFGEIMDGGVKIAPSLTPRLSVVVPVSGQVHFTAGFLKSAAFAIETLKARRGDEAELIVVDNGSRDDTPAVLAALPGVRVERFEQPIGFPAAVNAGASVARGDIILVANNDIEFEPNAFDRLIAALDDDPSVGVVGAKVILPNETLQEVGAMLDRIGAAHGFGRGAEAVVARGIRRVEVDYVSGCFVGFRRADFESLAGFDESFSPGYYEEVDFSLRMKRTLGKTTVVDTGLAVTHFEHASFAKGRPPGASFALVTRNRRRVKLAHAAFFQGLEAGLPRQRDRRARHALADGPRILVVEDMIPSARLGSRFARQEAILDIFADMDIAFDIVAQTPSGRIDSYKDSRARVFRAWMPDGSLNHVLRNHGADYSHLWISGSHNLTRHASTLSQLKASQDVKVICDIETLASLSDAERVTYFGTPHGPDHLLHTVADELAASLEVDLWITANARDSGLLGQIGLGPVVEIGHPIRPRVPAVSSVPFADRHSIMFVGTVDDPAGAAYDGLAWILSQVWPRLRSMPDARLTLVGHWPDAQALMFKARFGDRIDFKGAVDDEDLAGLYAQTRVAIAPARFATAPHTRVVEAVSAGLPILMTDHVAERLGWADFEGLARARSDDAGEAYADWLARLYTDASQWDAQIQIQRSAILRMGDDTTLAEAVRQTLSVAGPFS